MKKYILALSAILVLSFNVHAGLDDSGVVNVCTVADLDFVRANPSGNYLQVCDIDLAGNPGFTPIGRSETVAFSGTYDGDNHTIYNATTNNEPQAGGFFGWVVGASPENKAFIKNLHLRNANITGGWFTGGIIGYTMNADVENVSITGTVTTNQTYGGGAVGCLNAGNMINSWADVTLNCANYCGGLVGSARLGVTVANSWADATKINGSGVYTGGLMGWAQADTVLYKTHANANFVTDRGYIGGLVGRSTGGVIIKSYATGRVETQRLNIGDPTGGLVGELNYDSIIHRSFADVEVVSGSQYTGGLVGYMKDSIVNRSAAWGNVTSQERQTGGLAGILQDGSMVLNSHSHGNVSNIGPIGRSSGAGGLSSTALNYNVTIVNSYTTSHVSSTDPNSTTVGAFLGHVQGTGHSMSGCYYNLETSGVTRTAAGVGMTTQEMHDEGNYAGWDFNKIWGMDNEGYPTLK